MSADHKSPRFQGNPLKGALDEMLDFGPSTDVVPPSADMTQRLLQLVQKIKEINERIDNFLPSGGK